MTCLSYSLFATFSIYKVRFLFKLISFNILYVFLLQKYKDPYLDDIEIGVRWKLGNLLLSYTYNCRHNRSSQPSPQQNLKNTKTDTSCLFRSITMLNGILKSIKKNMYFFFSPTSLRYSANDLDTFQLNREYLTERIPEIQFQSWISVNKDI